LSNDKKDLTRIEDLGEFIHEMTVDEEALGESESETHLPDLPFSEEDLSHDFGSVLETEFENNFEQEPEFPPEFQNTDEAQNSLSAESSGLYSDEQAQEELLNETMIAPSPLEEESLEDQNRPEYKTPETFEDVKNFSEISSFSQSSQEANPSFSVLIKNIRFIEDITDIIALMKEFGILTDSEEEVKTRLLRGSLLIPRISEYMAIYLSHKLRRFDMEVEIGLSELIHKPKHNEKPDVGIVSKHQLYQNQSHHFEFGHSKLSLSEIRVAASHSMEGFEILHYLGVATEHKFIESSTLENEDSEEVMSIYQELAHKLKAHALKANSNAVVGLVYQLTPLPSESGMGRSKYRLSCTGNLVWVNKL
jgi:hypothetical protein